MIFFFFNECHFRFFFSIYFISHVHFLYFNLGEVVVTAHSISHNGDPRMDILDVMELISCTAENIGEKVFKLIADYELDVVAILSDSAANMVKALGSAPFPRISCACHIFNLILSDALKFCPDLCDLVLKLNSLVNWIRGRQEVRIFIEQLFDEDEDVLLVKPTVPTRFFSFFLMLERLLKMAPKIHVVYTEFSDRRGFPGEIYEEEWKTVKNIVIILTPLHRSCLLLQSHFTPSGVHTVPAISQLLLMYQILLPECTRTWMSSIDGNPPNPLPPIYEAWSDLSQKMQAGEIQHIQRFVRYLRGGKF